MFLFSIVILLAVLLLFAFLRASFLICSVGMIALAMVFAAFMSVFWVFLIVLWVPLMMPQVRYFLFSKRVFALLKRQMPPMSQTEKDAIDAGDVWWDAELFSGKPSWKKLHKLPKPELTAEEQAFIDNQVDTLCGMIDDWKIVHEDYDLPKAVWDYLRHEKFFGMVIGKEYGGLGFSALAHSTVVMKIATRSPTSAVTAMVPNSLGPGELLVRYGTQAQKDHYLPRLASGDDIPCFALTGPYAGSDAASLPDYAIVCEGEYQGETVLGMRVNWDKRYITLAPVATLLGLAFHLYDPDHLLGDKEEIGITLGLIPTDHPGVEIGHRHYPAFMPFMNGPTRGKDVFIPMTFVIGGEPMVGHGWRMLMECLSTGRSISLPSISTASGKLGYRMTGAYSRIRHQFNTAIAKFEGVEVVLARIAGFTYLLEAMRVMTAHAVDEGNSPAIVSAIAKYHATEMSRQLINDAMDIHGGRGIQMGPRNYLSSGYAGIPVSITVEGANILTRNLIIFGQGLIRCHPVLLDEMTAVNHPDPKEGLKQFDRALIKHMGHITSNLVRTLYFGMTGCHLVQSPVPGPFAQYYKQLSRMSSALAFCSDMALLSLGGALKRKENLSARLGDVLSYLYMASTVLKYYVDQGRHEDDVPTVTWVLDHCLYQAQSALSDFFENFPGKWLKPLLRFIVFPYGQRFKKPADYLAKQMVSHMVAPSPLRDRLTRYCYIGQKDDDPTGRVENALHKVIAAEAIDKVFVQARKAGKIKAYQAFEDQLRQAVDLSILTEQEAQTLKIAHDAIADVIAVDEFDKSYFE